MPAKHNTTSIFLTILLVSVEALLLLFIFKIFIFDIYTVSKLSMRPQIDEGEIVLAEKISMGVHLHNFFSSPRKEIYLTAPMRNLRIDDVIIFHSPLGAGDEPWIKKIEATDADILHKKNNEVWREQTFLFSLAQINEILPLTTTHEDANHDFFAFLASPQIETFTMPKNFLLVLGANKKKSIDSRNFGLIDRQMVIGRVVYAGFPLKTSL